MDESPLELGTEIAWIVAMTSSGSAQLLLNHVVPAGHGRAVQVRAGQLARGRDLYGEQVGDLFAFMDIEAPQHRSCVVNVAQRPRTAFGRGGVASDVA